jgi:hypothetical protein
VNRVEVWYIVTQVTRRALRRYSKVFQKMKAGGFTSLMDYVAANRLDSTNPEISEIGKYGVQGPLESLGESFGYVTSYNYFCQQNQAGRQDGSTLEVEWYGRKGMFLAARIDRGINAFSVEALKKCDAKHKVLISASVIVEKSLQRRDEARHEEAMKDHGIIHVAPFWMSSMEKESKIRMRLRPDDAEYI